jgi:Na+-transporting methylmalonyl-CoA/oxaloacetate decarboxylase gamma subunit
MNRSEIEARAKAFVDHLHAKLSQEHAKPFLFGLAVGLLLAIFEGITLYFLRLVGVVLLIAALLIFLMWLVGDEEDEEGCSEKAHCEAPDKQPESA